MLPCTEKPFLKTQSVLLFQSTFLFFGHLRLSPSSNDITGVSTLPMACVKFLEYTFLHTSVINGRKLPSLIHFGILSQISRKYNYKPCPSSEKMMQTQLLCVISGLILRFGRCNKKHTHLRPTCQSSNVSPGRRPCDHHSCLNQLYFILDSMKRLFY